MQRRSRILSGCVAPLFRTIAACMLMCVLGAGAAQASEKLRIIISDSIPPPYLLDTGTDPAGLAVNLCRVIAKHLGFVPDLVVVPSKRVPEMIRMREADMLCHVSPNWYPDPELLDFGTILYPVRNVLIGPVDGPPLCDDCTPTGDVATVIGYSYGPHFNEAFGAGTATRRDVRTEEGVYRTVRAGRIPMGILSEQTFVYFGGGHDGLGIKAVAASFPVTVGVIRDGRVNGADLMRVTAALKPDIDIDPAYQMYLTPTGVTD